MFSRGEARTLSSRFGAGGMTVSVAGPNAKRGCCEVGWWAPGVRSQVVVLGMSGKQFFSFPIYKHLINSIDSKIIVLAGFKVNVRRLKLAMKLRV